jgi:hypothetical protein
MASDLRVTFDVVKTKRGLPMVEMICYDPRTRAMCRINYDSASETNGDPSEELTQFVETFAVEIFMKVFDEEIAVHTAQMKKPTPIEPLEHYVSQLNGWLRKQSRNRNGLEKD